MFRLVSHKCCYSGEGVALEIDQDIVQSGKYCASPLSEGDSLQHMIQIAPALSEIPTLIFTSRTSRSDLQPYTHTDHSYHHIILCRTVLCLARPRSHDLDTPPGRELHIMVRHVLPLHLSSSVLCHLDLLRHRCNHFRGTGDSGWAGIDVRCSRLDCRLSRSFLGVPYETPCQSNDYYCSVSCFYTDLRRADN
jgi:hypothetical protein